MKKRLSAPIALAAGLALAVGSGGLASFADDAEEPVVPVVEIVEPEAPVVETPVIESEADEPVFVAAKGPKEPKPKLSICHSGSGKNWTFIQPDAQGYNGHQNHSHDIYGLTEAECLGKNTVTEWHTWVLSEVFVTPPTQGTDVAWPQTYLGAGKLVPEQCGLWVQQDKYTGTRAQIDAILADGLLTQEPGGYEDRDVIQEWKFAYSGDCPVVEPEPVVCTLDGDWFSESDDAAPVLTIDGLRFDGGTGKATGIGHAINGDFATFTGADYTATGDTAQLYYRLVIDSTADGGWSYQSLTVVDGAPVSPSSLAYSNKVGATKTIAEWQSLYPNAVMTFEFIHLDSAAPEGVSAVVSAFESGCGSATWGIEAPADLSGDEWDTVEVCVEPLDGTLRSESWVREWTQGFVPNGDRTAWVAGEVVYGEWTLHDYVVTDDAECAPVEEPPVEEPPTEEPPVVEPPVVTPPVPSLAVTGLGDSFLAWLFVGLIAGGAGTFFVLNERRKRKQ